MSNCVGTPKLFFLCFINRYLMFLLILLICKLCKSYYMPLGKSFFLGIKLVPSSFFFAARTVAPKIRAIL